MWVSTTVKRNRTRGTEVYVMECGQSQCRSLTLQPSQAQCLRTLEFNQLDYRKQFIQSELAPTGTQQCLEWNSEAQNLTAGGEKTEAPWQSPSFSLQNPGSTVGGGESTGERWRRAVPRGIVGHPEWSCAWTTASWPPSFTSETVLARFSDAHIQERIFTNIRAMPVVEVMSKNLPPNFTSYLLGYTAQRERFGQNMRLN